jgi:hypothetical protein
LEEGYWELPPMGYSSNNFVITDKGRELVREKIDTIKGRRRERAAFWVSAVTTILGLLLGILALLKQ